MHRFAAASFFALALAFTLSAADWYQFRGPEGQGHSDAKLVAEWNTSKNVTWRKELPGVGWSSPVVVGKHLIFSIDGTDKQMVVALDKTNGKVAWTTPRNNKTGANPFSFTTPLLIKVKDQEQLISPGSGVVIVWRPAWAPARPRVRMA